MRSKATKQKNPVVPDTWTNPKDLIKATRTRTVDLTKIRICKSYLAIPIETWKELGSPMRCSAYMDGWDLMIVPAAEIQIRITKNFARIWFHHESHWHRLMVPGLYDYSVDHDAKSGLVALRIQHCNFNNIDVPFRERWYERWDKLIP